MELGEQAASITASIANKLILRRDMALILPKSQKSYTMFMQDYITFLIIGILLLWWSIIRLDDWLVRPQESVERLAKFRRVVRKIFPFLSPIFTIFAWGFADRNPQIVLARGRTSAKLSVILCVIWLIIGIYALIKVAWM